MRASGRVHTVTMGGQHTTGPIQSVGGTKGGFVSTIDKIRSRVQEIFEIYTEDLDDGAKLELDQTPVGKLMRSDQPLIRSWDGTKVGSRVNPIDKIRRGDASQTPLEFVYDAADCRLYYDFEMIGNVTNTWRIVRDTKWTNNYDNCVSGSTGHESSVSGGLTLNGERDSSSPDSNSDESIQSNASLVSPTLFGLVLSAIFCLLGGYN